MGDGCCFDDIKLSAGDYGDQRFDASPFPQASYGEIA